MPTAEGRLFSRQELHDIQNALTSARLHLRFLVRGTEEQKKRSLAGMEASPGRAGSLGGGTPSQAPNGQAMSDLIDTMEQKREAEAKAAGRRLIKEEDGLQKEWHEEARKQTAETLPAFLTKLLNEYQHDYGTICHAMAAAGVGAVMAIEHSPQGGITGFQAGAVMWEFCRSWMQWSEAPRRLLDFNDALYPQNEDRFRAVSAETAEWLKKQAANMLSEQTGAHPDVRAHWERVAAGEMPFGFRVAG